MESNWRLNVALAGMSMSDWRLASRSLEDLEYLIVAIEPVDGPRYQVWHWPDPDQLPTFVANLLKAPVSSHFPYGNGVEPD